MYSTRLPGSLKINHIWNQVWTNGHVLAWVRFIWRDENGAFLHVDGKMFG